MGLDILGVQLFLLPLWSLGPVADTFDPYREALVMETDTVWPAQFADLPASDRLRLEEKLHANPQACGQLDYIRTHTGFCRQITVTDGDVQRLNGAPAPCS